MSYRTLGTSLALLFATSLVGASPSSATPYNARQSEEGYWIGGEPTPEDAQWFEEQGVLSVFGSTYLARSIQNVLAEVGVEWARIPFRSRSPETEELLLATKGLDPSTVYLHCEYGADRSGVMLAYLLVAYHGWRPDNALLAVVYADGHSDEDNLVRLLEENGYTVSEEDRARYSGIYSGARNGGSGGLKVRGEDYVTLINNTLDAITQLGVPLDEGATFTRNTPDSYTSQVLMQAEAEREAEEAAEAAEQAESGGS